MRRYLSIPIVLLSFVVGPSDGWTQEEPPATPTFLLEVAPGLVVCASSLGAFRPSLEDSPSPPKSQLQLRAGTIELPTTEDRFPGRLFETVRFGAPDQVLEEVAPGEFVLRHFTDSDDITHYRFTFTQDFADSDGGVVQVGLVLPLQFRVQGVTPLDGPFHMDEAFFINAVGNEPIQGTIDGVPSLRFGSCGYAPLPLYEMTAQLDDGATLHLRERNGQAVLFDFQPAALLGAEFTRGEDRRVVSSYWDLTLVAFRFHMLPRYLVRLEPPVSIEGLPDPVRFVELASSEESSTNFPTVAADVQARYLDEDLGELATLRVLSFSTEAIENAPFQRGDVNGSDRADLLDVVIMTSILFVDGATLPCLRSADVDASDTLNVADPLFLLNHIFGHGPRLPWPSGRGGCDSLREPVELTCDELTCSF